MLVTQYLCTRKFALIALLVYLCFNIFYLRYSNFYVDNAISMNYPTLFENYVQPEIQSGLQAKSNGFYLNEKKITLHSGALHYFRVPQAYWRDRLRKLRAAGLNAVETYVSWNLHEPVRNEYDFGNGNNDFSEFLDIVKFIKIAQEEDLFVIVRPGPYICAEWDFGGLPSWLLNEEGLKLRTSEPKFLKRVVNYFNNLLPLFTDLQFTKGGPIIAFQIENEYGSIEEDGTIPDLEYLKEIKKLFENHGLVEMFFTSDTPSLHGDAGALPGVLQMANFKTEPEKELNLLKKLQPNKPAMVMEYWTGWFDHWLEPYHSTEPVDAFIDVLERILKFPSSVNFYMFHGGTNFGFMNGANKFSGQYQSDVTSYDYDAPLTEAGDYTKKYHTIKEVLAKYQDVVTKLPELPAESKKVAYPTLKVVGHLDFDDIIDQVPEDYKVELSGVTSMENLPIKNGNGQSYGYINYRKKVSLNTTSTLKISGHVQDTAIVLVDGKLRSKPLENADDITGFGYWQTKDSELKLSFDHPKERTLDIIVENWGRVNFGVLAVFDQRKGLWQGPVYLDDKELKDWEIYALEFNSKWVKSLKDWKRGPAQESGPSISRVILNLANPQDTFIDLRGWSKGVVFVNGFNLGRYCHLGPTRTLYLPAPLLKTGENEIVIFDHFKSNSELNFLDYPILGELEPPGRVFKLYSST